MKVSTLTHCMLDKHQGCLKQHCKAISSLKISFLTGRSHNLVLNNIRNLVNELIEQDDKQFVMERCYRVESLSNQGDRYRPHHHFLLNDLLAHTLVAGYRMSLHRRLQLIQRLQRHFGRQ